MGSTVRTFNKFCIHYTVDKIQKATLSLVSSLFSESFQVGRRGNGGALICPGESNIFVAFLTYNTGHDKEHIIRFKIRIRI